MKKIRFLTLVFGDRYTDMLLKYGLQSHFSHNNIPSIKDAEISYHVYATKDILRIIEGK